MSILSIEDFIMPAVENGEDDSVPPVSVVRNLQQPKCDSADEDDELYLGFGFESSAFPYRVQNNYSRQLKNRTFKAVRLENKYLKAIFLPELGGRLWELHDKIADKPLLFVNPVYRLGNLAVRNAWFSGGVEFNCGIIGHHPHTCECIHSASGTFEDGTPYFRMYEFERIRALTYQIDAFLPKDSKFLMIRCKIINMNDRVMPAYWWSNIAVPAYAGGRVIVPAQTAFSQAGGKVHKRNVPVHNNVDITYPENTIDAFDYFWNVPENARKYVTHVDKTGYGLVQFSTKRLKGRKLFVWGQSSGSRRWQSYLSDGTKNGNYHEIQAGLGKTQYECLPMPPFTTWEWLEAYGAMQIDPKAAFGEWTDAQNAAQKYLDDNLSENDLNMMLDDTRAASKTQAENMVTYGSGWAALENERRRLSKTMSLPSYLSFAKIGELQKGWFSFLQNNEFTDNSAFISYMRQTEWTAMLENSVKGAGKYSYEVNAHLGLIALANNNLEVAKRYLDISLTLKPSCEAMFGLATIAKIENNFKLAADYATGAARLSGNNHHYEKQAVEYMHNASQHEQVIKFMDNHRYLYENGRCKMYAAFALVKLNELTEAEALIMENGGLELPDLREGETTITQLWVELQDAKRKQGITSGIGFDGKPPEFFDFRLHEEENK